MAQQKPIRSVEVNLLLGDDLESRPGGKFLKWALSWGKRIVIITEAIVILAFLSRFWLDTRVADLNDKITAQKNVVIASAKFESQFRAMKTQVSKVRQVNDLVSPLFVYDKLVQTLPASIMPSQVAVTSSTVSFTGTSDEVSLALLVAAMRQSPNFTDLSVGRITKTGLENTVDFSIQATFVP